MHAQTNTKMVCKVLFDEMKMDTMFQINDSVHAYVNLECTSSKIKMKSPLVLSTQIYYIMKNMDVFIDSEDNVIIRIHENSCEQFKTAADRLEKLDDFIIMKGHASFSFDKNLIEAENILVINSNSNIKKMENYDKYFY